MANRTHVRLLRKGVRKWNAKFARDGFIADLTSFDALDAFYEPGKNTKSSVWLYDLSGILLREALLNKSRFSGANLSRADFSRAKMKECFLSGTCASANFSGADLTGAHIRSADLSNANLHGSILSLANMTECNLKRANLDRAVFRQTDLRGSKFSDASVLGAEFTGADVGTHFTKVMQDESWGTFEWTTTDLSGAKGIKQEQLEQMNGDSWTVIPVGLFRPRHWFTIVPPDDEEPGQQTLTQTSDKSNAFTSQPKNHQAPSYIHCAFQILYSS